MSRLILNYKRLPYRTTWVEFPDIENSMRAINAPPTSRRPDGRPVYTLPVILDPMRSSASPTILSNPAIIAEYLEVTYPARFLFPDGSKSLQTLFAHYLQEVFIRPLLPVMIPQSHQRLPERSQAHFFPQGQRPPDPYAAGPNREQAWQAVYENFSFLASIMDKNNGDDGDGIVVSGREITYADFALCAILIWIEKMSPQDGWLRVKQWHNGRWLRLWERCREFMDIF